MIVDLSPVRDLVTQHGRVGTSLQEIVDSNKGKQEFESTLRNLLARSQKYARAAIDILGTGHWEAAALIVRAISEDTAVLGYIHAKGARKKEFAALYSLGFAIRQQSMLKELDACGVVDWTLDEKQIERERIELTKRVKKFTKLRADLWEGERKEDGTPKCRDTWNGLTIHETWKQASLQSQYSYLMNYTSLCQYVHSDSSSFVSGGFATEFGMADVKEEAQQTALVAVRLLVTVVVQLAYVMDLVTLGPDVAMLPDLDTIAGAMDTICTSARAKPAGR